MGGSRPDLKLFLVGSCAVIAALFGGWFVYEGTSATPRSLQEPRYLFALGGAAASLLMVAAAAIVIRKRVDEVTNSEQRFRSLLESAPDAIVITTREGRIVLVNTRAEQLFCYSREELLGSPVEGLFRRQLPERAATYLGDVSMSLGQRPGEPEFVGHRKDGSEIAIEVSFSPLETRDGLLVINVVRDITERRMSERRRACRYAARRVLAEARSFPVAAASLLQVVCENLGWDFGRFWLADQETLMLRRVGTWPAPGVAGPAADDAEDAVPPDEGLLGLVWRTGEPAWNAEDGPGPVAEGYRAVLAVPLLLGREVLGVLEFRSRTPQQPDESMLETVSNVGTQVVHFLQRRQSEEALRQSEARKAAVLEAALDAIVTFDQEGKVLECNPAAEAMFACQRASLLGRDMVELFPPGEARERFRHTLSAGERGSGTDNHPAAAQGGMAETTALRVDGTEFPVELAVSRIRSDGPPVFTCYVRDLSERRRTEEALRQSEERFRQLQKMEAVGTLAGGVAHDFNNLLTVILGCTEYLLSRSTPEDPTHPYLQMIKKSGERGAKLTRQLLTFCRKQVTSRKLLDLSGVLADMHDMLLRIIGEDIQLTTRLAPDLRATRADPAQVEQIVMNLAANARDAMCGGGKLAIETANVELDEGRAAACPDLQPGPYVVLSVSDTGCGMSEATKSRLFEPFFTTKEVGKGTGLGLATVYGIVRGSAGHIEVESELGRGTTFRVYLPGEGDMPTRNGCPGSPAEPRPEAPAQPAWQPVAAPPRPDATILLVEDEEWVRSLTRQVLQDTGYSVLEARHGAEALRLWDTHKEVVRLIVTDVVMPEMSGFELARRVLDQRPNLKVLFISGYTDIDIASTGLLDRGAVFLPKPFGPADLSNKLHELLCA